VPGKQRFVFGHGWAKSVNSISLVTIAPDNVTTNNEARKFMINTTFYSSPSGPPGDIIIIFGGNRGGPHLL
jgi:hypothetical protein